MTLFDIHHRANKEINNVTPCCHLKLHILERHTRKGVGSIKVYKDGLSSHFRFAEMNQRAGNLHSNKSARVLVRSATGRLVLSLVMANSCIPSSSATLACVRLFTRELRRSCGWTNRGSHFKVRLSEHWKHQSKIHTAEVHRNIKMEGKHEIIHQRQTWLRWINVSGWLHVSLLNIALWLGAERLYNMLDWLKYI